MPDFEDYNYNKIQKEISEILSQKWEKKGEEKSVIEKSSFNEVLEKIKKLLPGELIQTLPSRGFLYPFGKPVECKIRPPTGYDIEKVIFVSNSIDLSKELPDDLKKTALFDSNEDWSYEIPWDFLLVPTVVTPLEVSDFSLFDLTYGDYFFLSFLVMIYTWGNVLNVTCPDGHKSRFSLSEVKVTYLEDKDVFEEKQWGSLVWKVNKDTRLIEIYLPEWKIRLDFSYFTVKDTGFLAKGKNTLLLVKNLKTVYMDDRSYDGTYEEKADLIANLPINIYTDVATVLTSLSGLVFDRTDVPVRYGIEKILSLKCSVCGKEFSIVPLGK